MPHLINTHIHLLTLSTSQNKEINKIIKQLTFPPTNTSLNNTFINLISIKKYNNEDITQILTLLNEYINRIPYIKRTVTTKYYNNIDANSRDMESEGSRDGDSSRIDINPYTNNPYSNNYTNNYTNNTITNDPYSNPYTNNPYTNNPYTINTVTNNTTINTTINTITNNNHPYQHTPNNNQSNNNTFLSTLTPLILTLKISRFDKDVELTLYIYFKTLYTLFTTKITPSLQKDIFFKFYFFLKEKIVKKILLLQINNLFIKIIPFYFNMFIDNNLYIGYPYLSSIISSMVYGYSGYDNRYSGYDNRYSGYDNISNRDIDNHSNRYIDNNNNYYISNRYIDNNYISNRYNNNYIGNIDNNRIIYNNLTNTISDIHCVKLYFYNNDSISNYLLSYLTPLNTYLLYNNILISNCLLPVNLYPFILLYFDLNYLFKNICFDVFINDISNNTIDTFVRVINDIKEGYRRCSGGYMYVGGVNDSSM
ncbi:hypothetical protein CWI37_2533p0010, partial [Hamiltosporidium tvaerminnensis]